MTTRTITGPLRHPESDTLWASATLTFRLRAPFVSSGATYPTETITVTSDGSGQFSVALAVPPSGTVLYIVTLPDGRELGLNLSTGTATTLHALLATAQVVVPQNALQTAIDAEAAVRAAADTTLQANIDAEAAARANADSAHASLTTTAHGGIVASSDSRLSDSRTPTAHASTHASAGSDPLTLAESQITGLVADLALKSAAGLANIHRRPGCTHGRSRHEYNPARDNSLCPGGAGRNQRAGLWRCGRRRDR
jgi:hypothetical protein